MKLPTLIGALLTATLIAMSGWAAAADDGTAVGERLAAFYGALTSGDVEHIESFVVTGERFAMVEGKHANWGWADYRDNHLSGELEDLAKVEIRIDVKNIETGGDLAFVSYLFAISPKGDPETSYGSGRATAILVREQGRWLILHLHTS